MNTQQLLAGQFLFNEVSAQLCQRLELITLKPQQILCIGALNASIYQTSGFKTLFPSAQVTFAPIQFSALSQPLEIPKQDICQRYLGCKPASVDLIVANLALHWYPPLMLQAMRQALRRDGVLAFSIFGPDSFIEYRQIWYECGGYEYTAPRFIDMHHWGDELLHVGFFAPVVESEVLRLGYQRGIKALRDVRALIGAPNARSKLSQVESPHQSLSMRSTLGLPSPCALARTQLTKIRELTVELVYGHAFSPSDFDPRIIPIHTS